MTKSNYHNDEQATIEDRFFLVSIYEVPDWTDEDIEKARYYRGFIPAWRERKKSENGEYIPIHNTEKFHEYQAWKQELMTRPKSL